MKAEFRFQGATLAAAATIEVWHDGRKIACLQAADGPGVRVTSLRPMRAAETIRSNDQPRIVTVWVGRNGGKKK